MGFAAYIYPKSEIVEALLGVKYIEPQYEPCCMYVPTTGALCVVSVVVSFFGW